MVKEEESPMETKTKGERKKDVKKWKDTKCQKNKPKKKME